MWIAGVDGCQAGWIVVLAELAAADSEVGRRRAWNGDRSPKFGPVLAPGTAPDPGRVRARVVPTFAELLRMPERPVAIALDMPIGLAAIAERGGRPCDRLSRAELRNRASTIFSPPARPALEAFLRGGDYIAVCAANRAATAAPKRTETGVRTADGPMNGLAISKQAFHLLPKLAEIDAAITPAKQRRVKEAHPELAFMRANGGTVLAPKKSAEGSRSRRRLLSRLGLLTDAIERVIGAGVARDDLYDAAILCDVARRIALGTAFVRGGERDPRGIRMEIVT